MAHPVRIAVLIVGAIVVLSWTGYAVIETYFLGNPDAKFGTKGGVQFALLISLISAAVFSIGAGLAYYLFWRKRTPDRRVLLSVALVTGSMLAALRNHIIADPPSFLFQVFGDWDMVFYGFFLSFACGAATAAIGQTFELTYGPHT